MTDLTLRIGSADYGGWTAARVTESMEQMAATFDLEVTDRWPGQPAARRIRPGDAAELRIAGHQLIQGYVDTVDISYSATEHSISIRGRDATGDLIDCTAECQQGEFRDQTMADIASQICRPFGVLVNIEGDAGDPFPVFKLQEGETVFESLERMARLRKRALGHTVAGNLNIFRTGTERYSRALQFGANILRASGTFSWSDRYSRYTAKGQRQGSDDEDEASVSQGVAESTDAQVSRHRPLTLLAEGQANTADLQGRADWQRNINAGRAARASITVQGWLAEDDRPWKINRLIPVHDSMLGVDEDLLIAAVTFDLSDRGTTSTLTLVRPEVFDDAPLVQKSASTPSRTTSRTASSGQLSRSELIVEGGEAAHWMD